MSNNENRPVIKHVWQDRHVLCHTLPDWMWTSSADYLREEIEEGRARAGVKVIVMRKFSHNGDQTQIYTLKRVDDGSFEADMEYLPGSYMGEEVPEGYML